MQEANKFPLSFGQKALWFIHKTNPNSGAYNFSTWLRSDDDVDTATLKKAILAVIAEQSMLRSRYKSDENGEPVREVIDLPEKSLEFDEFPEVCEFENICQLLRQESEKPFDLERDCCVRVRVYRHKVGHTISICFHHIYSEISARDIFLRRLKDFYEEYAGGSEAPPVTIADFSEFVAKEQDFVESQDGIEALDFWKEKLAGELPLLSMPLDKVRPIVQSYNGDSVKVEISHALFSKLKEVSRAESTSVYSTVLSVFRLFLAAYTGQDDIIIGSTFKKTDEIFSNTIGYFVNKIALRIQFGEQDSFREMLQSTTEVVRDAFSYSEYPFPLLVEKLRVARDAGVSPVFQANLAYSIDSRDQDNQVPKPHVPNWRLERLSQSEGHFDLSLMAVEHSDQLSAHFQFNKDLFSRESVTAMAECFYGILEQVVANPNMKISDLNLLPPSQRDLVMEQFNHTSFECDKNRSVIDLFDECVHKFAMRTAVKFGSETLTYDQLDKAVSIVAGALKANGLKRGDIVGLLIEPSVDTIVGMLSVLRAGGTYSPIEPSMPEQRIEYVLQDSRAKCLLTGLSAPREFRYDGARIDLRTLWRTKINTVSESVKTKVDPNDAAYVIYTSGTTGNPKGAILLNRNLVNYVEFFRRRYEINEQHKAALLTSYAFDLGYTTLWTTILSGGELHLLPDETTRNISDLLQYFRTNQISFIKLTPSLLNAIVTSPDFNKEGNFSSVQVIVTGGEKIKPTDIRAIYSSSSSVRVINHYGPTETTIGVMTYPIRRNDIDDFAANPVIGRPIGNVRAYIVNKNFKPLPIGVPGELIIAGAGVGKGYLGREDLTKEKFIPDPFQTGLNAYRTGDLTKWRKVGTIEFLGRIDRQVKIRGYRVELEEIEKQILKFPGIEKIVVIDKLMGADNRILCAYFVGLKEIDESALRKHLGSAMPEYMVPSFFVRLDKIPVNANGKLDAKALPEPELKTKSVVKPTSPLELKLSVMWSKILGLDVNSISATATFFELGGHSILVIKLLSELKKQFAFTCPISTIYNGASVQSLSSLINEATKGIHNHSTDSAESNQKTETQSQDSSAEAASQLQFVKANKLNTKDLIKDAQLDQSFNRDILSSSQVKQAREKIVAGSANSRAKILFTGATGFLGVNVIADILKNTECSLTCLVRGKTDQEAEARLKRTFADYDLAYPSSARIKVICGDLGSKGLGIKEDMFNLLSKEVDCIFHFGAWVNHLYTYDDLKAVNVDGMREILRFATLNKVKRVVYMSSLAVGAESEDADLDHGRDLFAGYGQTKWVSERMIKYAADCGLPTIIFRPPQVTWDSQTGTCNTEQFECIFLKACLETKHVPDFQTLKTLLPHLAPLDFLVSSVTKLAFEEVTGRSVYHLFNPAPVNWTEILASLKLLGLPLKQVSFDEWIAIAAARADSLGNDAKDLRVGLNLTAKRMAGKGLQTDYSLKIVCDKTLRVLGGIELPKSEGPKSIAAWVAYMSKKGFLKLNYNSSEGYQ